MSMEDFVKTLNDEQKKALLEALSQNSPTIQSIPKEVNEQTKKAIDQSFIAESKPNIYNQKRREPVKARKNEWEDTGEFRDITTPDYERTPRRRQSPPKSEVECHICGKSFKVDQRFVFGEFYRCNRCTGKK
jgi:predicted SprT family Zn-dependent metalloprotease